MSAAIGLAMAGAIGFALTGCGSSGGGDAPPSAPEEPLGPAISVQSVTILATTDSATALSITGTDDASGRNASSPNGTSHQTSFALGSQLPSDPGRTGRALHLGFDLDDGDSPHHLDCIINPPHDQVVDSDPVRFKARRHLVERSGLGASWDEIEAAMGVSHAEAVDALLAGLRQTHHQGAPYFLGEPILSWRERGRLSQQARDDLQDNINDWSRDLRRWWHQEMLLTPSPLTERLVLFWHGVWTSSLSGTPYPHLMYVQNQTLRQWGTVNFAELARRLPKDPAMILYLDSDSNVKGRPNENFARELLELFSLGEGQDYDEADIPEIARCFTGYGLDDHFNYRFKTSDHDDGEKTVFGQTGHFTGDDVIEMVLAKRRCAEYICEQLFDEFISGPRDNTLIGDMTDLLHPSYDLVPVLRMLFTSNAFTNTAGYGTRMKSPVELVIGTFRRVELDWSYDDSPWTILWRTGSCDQDIFYPPNVRGWPRGTDWVDAKNFLTRRKQAKHLGWYLENRLPPHLADGLQDLLLSINPVGSIDTRSLKFHYRTLLLDPAYQVN
ncbi:MAG: DUF1800 family protein [Planctomycetota bacterium]|jgi:uncharacterized protein (DUF1800 family)|nr:DUF1800 family protein [Planctomycetota bacterium]